MSPERPRPRVWPVPIALGAATAIGLVAGLLGGGAFDALAWAALGAPVAVVLACAARPPRPAGRAAAERARPGASGGAGVRR